MQTVVSSQASTPPTVGRVSDPLSLDGPEKRLLAVNNEFYRSLESADLELMVSLWRHSAEVTCAHPGRPAIVGWDEVLASWEAIFAFGGNPQIIATEERAVVRGDIGWVTLTENMISDGHTGAATAINVFEHDGDRWRMVAHHAGPVLNRR